MELQFSATGTFGIRVHSSNGWNSSNEQPFIIFVQGTYDSGYSPNVGIQAWALSGGAVSPDKYKVYWGVDNTNKKVWLAIDCASGWVRGTVGADIYSGWVNSISTDSSVSSGASYVTALPLANPNYGAIPGGTIWIQ